ncbi:MAG TPA: hypothetical protein P5279_01205 [Anaerohalosphaeraceae bacterium]|jgi:hypothetical protein|nr:hypothetical protein [Anaerohalosphaeraceae bacterium]HRT49084.1 hypothetical protein [Anaerohalosphaeraceae bacterium]HRT85663.1 hypothetical protein [Anaerohalosphaeraceae bacterium]
MILACIAAYPFLSPLNGQTFYKELNLIGGYADADQWIGQMPGLKNAVGFEYFRKWAGDYGDFLTADLQVRFAYDSHADSEDAFGVEVHNAWLEYKLGLGESIRVGHFDPAFGLEAVLDTHGTLLQTLAFKNIGYKKDWGVAYQGLLGEYDYQVAAQLGSGMSINRKDDSFLLTGRIGTPRTQDTQFGLSVLYGQTLQSEHSWTIPAPGISDKSTRKTRIGVDFQSPISIFDFKAEAAFGENDGETVGGGLVRLGYTVPENQNLRFEFQTVYWSNDWGNGDARDLTLAPVIEYKLNPDTTLRLGYFHDLYSNDDNDRMVVLQLYYFGL